MLSVCVCVWCGQWHRIYSAAFIPSPSHFPEAPTSPLLQTQNKIWPILEICKIQMGRGPKPMWMCSGAEAVKNVLLRLWREGQFSTQICLVLLRIQRFSLQSLSHSQQLSKGCNWNKEPQRPGVISAWVYVLLPVSGLIHRYKWWKDNFNSHLRFVEPSLCALPRTKSITCLFNLHKPYK